MTWWMEDGRWRIADDDGDDREGKRGVDLCCVYVFNFFFFVRFFPSSVLSFLHRMNMNNIRRFNNHYN